MTLLLVLTTFIFSVCVLIAEANDRFETLKREITQTNHQVQTVDREITELSDAIQRQREHFDAEINKLIHRNETISEEMANEMNIILSNGAHLNSLYVEEDQTRTRAERAKTALKGAKLVLKWLSQDVENLRRRKNNGDEEVCFQLRNEIYESQHHHHMDDDYRLKDSGLPGSRIEDSVDKDSPVQGRSMGLDANTLSQLSNRLLQERSNLFALKQRKERMQREMKTYAREHTYHLQELKEVIGNKVHNLEGIKRKAQELKKKTVHTVAEITKNKHNFESSEKAIKEKAIEIKEIKAELRTFQNVIQCYHDLQMVEAIYV